MVRARVARKPSPGVSKSPHRLGLVALVFLVVVVVMLAYQPRSSPPSGPSRQPNAPLEVLDARSDLFVEEGDTPSFDLSMIDALSLTLGNDGRVLSVTVETSIPFPMVFSPYGSGQEDELRMPDVSLDLLVKAENGKGVWVTLVASSLGFSVCALAKEMLCDRRWDEQPVRYVLHDRNIIVTFPLDMEIWEGTPNAVNARLIMEHSQTSPQVLVRDYVPGPSAGDSVLYRLWA